jgi:hypothetical protein
MAYGSKFTHPLGGSDKALGGAGHNMGIECLNGETDMVTVFDDFNSTIKGQDTFGAATIFEDSGWVLTDVGSPTNDEISMNDPSDVDTWQPSCIRIYPGDADDAGGNMQLDLINGAIGTLVGTADFPHLYIPETAAGATLLDGTTWMFACRLGIRADLTTTGSGAWDATTLGGKLFIGWAVAGESAIMTPGTGAISVAAAADKLVGFHVTESGAIEGISQREGDTAYAEGTNFETLVSAGGVAGTTANGAEADGDTMWFDLGLRMNILDWSEASGNGDTTFYWRRVPKLTGSPGSVSYPPGGEGLGRMQKHPTVLTDQIPTHTVAMVPTIEAINGPTAGTDCVFFLDWWTFGVSRFSRL